MKTLLAILALVLLSSCAANKQMPIPKPTPKPTFVGSWQGAWDETWEVQFDISHFQGNLYKVEYHWQESKGKPKRHQSLMGTKTSPTTITTGYIDITLEDDYNTAKAIGKFKNPRITILKRNENRVE